jgi:diaminopimelate decarboxylase
MGLLFRREGGEPSRGLPAAAPNPSPRPFGGALSAAATEVKMDYFDYKNHELYCEDVALSSIVESVGTPCYVYSSATFERHLAEVDRAWADFPHLVCYSVKVASNISLLSKVAKMGLGADIVSGGELFRALKAGVDPSKIVFSGVGKTAREMAEALDAKIQMFNVESAAELELLASVASARGGKAPVSIRVNPDVDPKTHKYVATGLKESKFGVPAQDALALYAKIALMPSLEVVGLDCHIGSQLLTVAPFVEAANKLKKILADLRELGVSIKYLDLGGGLGISYNDEKPPSPGEYARALLGVLEGEDSLIVVVEPGRVVAGNCAVLLTKVLYHKVTPAKSFLVVDAAMNDLVRPSLYGAFHGFWPLKANDGPLKPVDVVGPICESGDFLAKDRLLPPLPAGDCLAVRSAGAYGFSMSSNYNSRPRAAEVLVTGSGFRIIRERETYEDLVRGEAL